MLIIPVKEGESIERATKKLKRKFDTTKTLKLYRSKKHFIKKSVAKRHKIQKAAYTLKVRLQEN